MEDLEVMLMVNLKQQRQEDEAFAKRLAAISAKRKKGRGRIVQKMSLLRRKS